MTAQLFALTIVIPFAAVFIAAGLHEFKRHKSEGTATYGLIYDEETGTTHVGALSEKEDGFNPEDYDPAAYNVSGGGSDTPDDAVVQDESAQDVARDTASEDIDEDPARTA